MIFERLGSFIVKRYKLVLVVWILVLVLSVPLLMNASQVVTYEQSESFTSAGKSDSDTAAAIIEKQFPRAVSNSSMLVVLESDNVTSPAMRDFLMSFEESVRSDPDIKYFETGKPGSFPRDFISVYTAQDFVLVQAVYGMNMGMYQMAGTVSMVWGIPALYLQVYVSTSGNDTQAAAQVNETISAMSGGDAQVGGMLTAYFTLFRAQWESTASNISLLSDPQLRAELAARSAIVSLTAGPGMPAEQAQLMLLVSNSFNISTFSNPQMVRGFAVNAIAMSARIADTVFLNGTYDLGDIGRMSPINSSAAIHNYVSNVVMPNGTIDTYAVKLPSEIRSSFVSPDNRVTIVSLSFTKTDDWTDSNGKKPIVNNVVELRKVLKERKGAIIVTGIKTYVSGGAAITSDTMTAMEKDFSLIEFVTVPMIVVLMGLFFLSFVTPVLPLGAVMMALGLSQAVVYFIGTFVGGVDSNTTTMLFSILMGVGTDYSIFIVARFREERIKGATRDEAVKTSVTWAGESIATSGATVMIAFLSLGIGSFQMVRIMGLVMGLAISIALLISLTFVPSFLMLVGNRIFWPNNKERFKRYAKRIMERRAKAKHGYFYKAASFSVKRAPWVVLAAIIVTIPTTYIFLTATTSYDFIGAMPKVESINGMDAMTNGFGAGRIMPSNVVLVFNDAVLLPDGNYSSTALNTIESVSAALASKSMVREVDGPTRPYGATVDYDHPANITVNDRTKMREFIGQDNRTVRLSFVLNALPTSEKAVKAVPELRSAVHDAVSGQGVSKTYVGGSTASLYDTQQTMNMEFTQMELVVVIGIFIVLVIVLGSLFLPAFAIISILMSISWSFAATVLIFQNWLGVPILFLIPLILFIMLMGLGMDYNIFILTRIREEVHMGKSNDEAIVTAVDWTGGIISALAVIMGGAIGVLMLSSTKMLAEFGFAITFAVLMDAMVVRTYIVPATMKLLGKWSWYAPGALQREKRVTKKGQQ